MTPEQEEIARGIPSMGGAKLAPILRAHRGPLPREQRLSRSVRGGGQVPLSSRSGSWRGPHPDKSACMRSTGGAPRSRNAEEPKSTT